MNIMLVIFGLPLTLFGFVMCFGSIAGWTMRTSNHSVTADIIGFVFLGIAPLAVGVGLVVTGIVLLWRRRSGKEPNKPLQRDTASSPLKCPTLLPVIGFLSGAVLLLIFNLLLTFVIVVLQHPHARSLPYLIGNMNGYFLIPLAVILCICVIWKSNRRPYRLLLCLFWTLLVSLGSEGANCI